MPTMEELEARIAQLEALVGEQPPDADPKVPIIFSTRYSKIYHRSAIFIEREDASEVCVGRYNINELWNAEQPGAPSNAPTTLGLIYSLVKDDRGAGDTPDPNRGRPAQIGFKVKGIPTPTNRRGQITFEVNPGNGQPLRKSVEIDSDGSWRYGAGAEKYVEFADSDWIGTGDWREIKNPRGLLVVTNLSNGTSALFLVPNQGTIQKIAGSHLINVGEGGSPGIFLNFDWPSARYQLINRYSTPQAVAWKFSGGLNMPV